MCSHRVLACALMTGLVTGSASAQTPGIYGFRGVETRVAVRLAVEGAAARLARPAARTSSRTSRMNPASFSRPGWRQTGSVPSMPSGRCGSSMPAGLPNASGAECSRSQRSGRGPFACAERSSDLRFNGIASRPRSSSFTSSCMLLDSERIHPPAMRSRNGSMSDAATDTRIISRPNASIGPAKAGH